MQSADQTIPHFSATAKELTAQVSDLDSATKAYIITSREEYLAILKAYDALRKKIPVLQAARKDATEDQRMLENLAQALSTEQARQIADAIEQKAVGDANVETAAAATNQRRGQTRHDDDALADQRAEVNAILRAEEDWEMERAKADPAREEAVRRRYAALRREAQIQEVLLKIESDREELAQAKAARDQAKANSDTAAAALDAYETSSPAPAGDRQEQERWRARWLQLNEAAETARQTLQAARENVSAAESRVAEDGRSLKIKRDTRSIVNAIGLGVLPQAISGAADAERDYVAGGAASLNAQQAQLIEALKQALDHAHANTSAILRIVWQMVQAHKSDAEIISQISNMLSQQGASLGTAG